LVGELAVLRGEPRSASVRAVGRALVYGVGAHDFLQFVRAWPEVALAVARAIADGFVTAERRRHDELRAPLWVVVAPARAGHAFARDLAGAATRYVGAKVQSYIDADLAPAALAEAAARDVSRAALVLVAGDEERVGPSLRHANGVVITSGARPA